MEIVITRTHCTILPNARLRRQIGTVSVRKKTYTISESVSIIEVQSCSQNKNFCSDLKHALQDFECITKNVPATVIIISYPHGT